MGCNPTANGEDASLKIIQPPGGMDGWIIPADGPVRCSLAATTIGAGFFQDFSGRYERFPSALLDSANQFVLLVFDALEVVVHKLGPFLFFRFLVVGQTSYWLRGLVHHKRDGCVTAHSLGIWAGFVRFVHDVLRLGAIRSWKLRVQFHG